MGGGGGVMVNQLSDKDSCPEEHRDEGSLFTCHEACLSRVRRSGGVEGSLCLIGRLNSRQVLRTSRDTPHLSRWSGPRRFTHHKLRFDGDLLHVFPAPLDLIDDSLCRNLPHPYQRLSNRSEARVGVGRSGNVIESNHGDVFRHTQACFLDRPDRTDGGNIVVRKKRREWLLPRQQLFREWISNPWRRIGSFQLYGQLGPYENVQFLGDLTNRAPAHGGVRTDRLPLDEGDLFVPQFFQMLECQSCCSL